MVAVTRNVSVNITAIQSLFEPISGKNGVWDNAVKFSTETRVRMNENTPVRTGKMLAGNRNNTVPAFLHIYCTFWNVMNYSKFVREGTGYIVPKMGRWLKLPVEGAGRGGPFLYRQYVRGQEANDFIGKAVAESLIARSYA